MTNMTVQPDGPLSGEVKRGGAHTPGPWRKVATHRGFAFFGGKSLRGNCERTIAEVVAQGPADAEAAANADLIEAATLMAEALRAIRGSRKWHRLELSTAQWGVVNAAMAKANVAG